jgi:holo-ACP synthase/triphosphoribosyl-dephospho-CoA synthase
MQAGLPTIAHYALPELKQALARGLSVNDALLQVLLVITMQIDDTTIMNRHDLHKMRVWTRAQTKKVLSMGGLYTPAGKTAMKNLDQIFITENISPGGAADLLAVTWFVYRLEQQFG